MLAMFVMAHWAPNFPHIFGDNLAVLGATRRSKVPLVLLLALSRLLASKRITTLYAISGDNLADMDSRQKNKYIL